LPAITPRALAPKASDDFYRPASTISRGTTAIKPSAERVVRKKSLVTTSAVAESPSLLATFPGSGLITTVRVVGKNIFHNPDDESLHSTRGDRPSASLSSIAEQRTSPSRRRSSVVRFGSPSQARAVEPKKVQTPSILKKGGRKRKNDGPHVGSAKRHRKTESVLLDAPSDSSDEEEDENVSVASCCSDTEEEETEIIASRNSPRLKRSMTKTDDEGSPSSRTRRSLSNTRSINNKPNYAEYLEEDEEGGNQPPKRSTRASRGKEEPVAALPEPARARRSLVTAPNPKSPTRTNASAEKVDPPVSRPPRSVSAGARSPSAAKAGSATLKDVSLLRQTRSSSPAKPAAAAANVQDKISEAPSSPARPRRSVASTRSKAALVEDKSTIDVPTKRSSRSGGETLEAPASPANRPRRSSLTAHGSSGQKVNRDPSKRSTMLRELSLLCESSNNIQDLSRTRSGSSVSPGVTAHALKDRPKRKSAPTNDDPSPRNRRSSRKKARLC